MPGNEQDVLLAAVVSGTMGANGLAQRERALLAYAAKLTLDPAAVVAGDISTLLEVGLDDRAIHDACAVVAYFAFVNRIADGLGVELEDPEPV